MADSSNATTCLSELCVPLGLAMIAQGESPDIASFYTIGDLYDKADELNIKYNANRDIKFRDDHRHCDIYGEIDGGYYDVSIERYFYAAEEMADRLFGGDVPSSYDYIYELCGGENLGYDEGDPADFTIGDLRFSLKDNSPGLFGGTTKNLLRYIEPDLYEQLYDYETAVESGAQYLQGKTLFIDDKQGHRLKEVGYDWHLAAEETDPNRPYEQCLHIILDFFVQMRMAISQEAGSGFMLFDAEGDIDYISNDWEEDGFFDHGSNRHGRHVPMDENRWLAEIIPLRRNGELHPQNLLVLFDDYDPDTHMPTSYLGVITDRNQLDTITRQGIIPLGEWWDETDPNSFETLERVITVQGLMGLEYVEDPDLDLEPVFCDPGVMVNLSYNKKGTAMDLTSDIRAVLHRFADYGNSTDWPSPKFDTDTMGTVDDFIPDVDERTKQFFGDRSMPEYAFWEEMVYYNSSLKLKQGIDSQFDLDGRLGSDFEISEKDREAELDFLCFLFRIYDEPYYYVNVHKNFTVDILEVPSRQELNERNVLIAEAEIPEARSVALRFLINNNVAQDVQINIGIIGGHGLFTTAPECKITYTRGETNAKLATVYTYY